MDRAGAFLYGMRLLLFYGELKWERKIYPAFLVISEDEKKFTLIEVSFYNKAYFDMEIHIVKKNKWMHQLNPEKFLIEVEGYYG
ncbi:hypothetical protein JOC25_003117 [Solibacillus kalamii]|uniref:Uncharacterized protein n=1 Tax=Solibacillus kalamii TaxID=1748298 RepID=A0ABX3ZDE0_9BACL|nr:hypothetical protein [Solibacillus kalamii]OUZ37721.1 hypothetical protein CBM15_16025 [Solibacillus kalamii]